MLPNPLSTAAAGSEAGSEAGRPQLRLAARAESHSEREAPSIDAAIQEIVHRSHGEWRGTLDAVKETLATLERNCEAAIAAQEAGVAGLIETLVGRAAAEAEAAARQTQAQAQIEVAELQRALVTLHTMTETLKSDLDVERDSSKSIQAQLELEVTARARAEDERDEARRQCQQKLAAAEAQVVVLQSEGDAQKAELAFARQQLDAAVAEQAKLVATFQMVQRALTLGVSENVAVPVQNAQPVAPTAPEPRLQPSVAEKSSAAEVSGSVADPRAALAELHPDAVEDAQRVLEQVEAMYQLDLSSGRPGTEVVDSLTGSLRYARDVIVARWSVNCDAQTLFEYQVDVLLHTHAATAFGRHLSIAAYESRQQAAAAVKADSGPAQGSVS